MEKGDLREFVVSRYGALLRTAYLMVGDRDDAEDLVQVALLKAVRVWPRITVAPEAYVKKIMVNHLISHWRLRRVTELLTPLLPERAVVADTDLGLRDELWRALQRLPRRRGLLVTGATAAVLLLAAGLVPIAFEGSGSADILPAERPGRLVAPLFYSPTRGNLANDSTYVAAFKSAAQRSMRDPDGSPPNPSSIAVLFVGDVAGGRVGVVYAARAQGSGGAAQVFAAAGEASPEKLAAGGQGRPYSINPSSPSPSAVRSPP